MGIIEFVDDVDVDVFGDNIVAKAVHIALIARLANKRAEKAMKERLEVARLKMKGKRNNLDLLRAKLQKD